MKAKFNPTGTHVHKGFLKVRIDLYPSVGDKTYEIHHVLMPVIPEGGYPGEMITIPVKDAYLNDETTIPLDREDYNRWFDALPRVWQLNPALCHFIKIDQNTTSASLGGIVRQIFDKDTLTELDEALSKVDWIGLISPDIAKVRQVMRSKLGTGKKLPAVVDIPKLRDRLNTRFASLEIEV